LIYQEPTVAQNARGEDERTWQEIAPLWAEVMPLSGNELVLARQQAARATHSVKTRGAVTVKSIGRFVFGARLLYVEASLDSDERTIERVTLCREETA
jgi:SPP1 family predicted phage head-tail adaptor